MGISGETRATIPATLEDLNVLESKLTSRQDKYEETCEADRKALRGDVDSLTTIVKRVEDKTDGQTTLIQPIAAMFKGIFAHPKVQSGALLLVLAFLGFVTYRLQSMTQSTQPPQAQSIIVIPQQTQHTDGGVSTSTFTVQQ